VDRFLRGEQSAWPVLPEGYFSNRAVAYLKRYRERTEALRDPQLFGALPMAELAQDLATPWRKAAVAICRNWVDLVLAARQHTDAAAERV
jgi:hypothetical protein